MKRFLFKVVASAALGFAMVVGIGLLSKRLQNASEWDSWLWNEIQVNPQTTFAVVVIVAVALLWYTRKKKDDE